jgi:hypothetical protein
MGGLLAYECAVCLSTMGLALPQTLMVVAMSSPELFWCMESDDDKFWHANMAKFTDGSVRALYEFVEDMRMLREYCNDPVKSKIDARVLSCPILSFAGRFDDTCHPASFKWQGRTTGHFGFQIFDVTGHFFYKEFVREMMMTYLRGPPYNVESLLTCPQPRAGSHPQLVFSALSQVKTPHRRPICMPPLDGELLSFSSLNLLSWLDIKVLMVTVKHCDSDVPFAAVIHVLVDLLRQIETPFSFKAREIKPPLKVA